jgi:hypothetical protein
MTRFAAILVGGIGELTFVNVLMAVLTFCLRNLENSVFTLQPLWQVTLVTSYGQVAAFERIFCCCMILDGKG